MIAAPAPAFAAPDGGKIYGGTCIVCHGANGGGNASLTDNDLKAVIRYMKKTFGR